MPDSRHRPNTRRASAASGPSHSDAAAVNVAPDYGSPAPNNDPPAPNFQGGSVHSPRSVTALRAGCGKTASNYVIRPVDFGGGSVVVSWSLVVLSAISAHFPLDKQSAWLVPGSGCAPIQVRVGIAIWLKGQIGSEIDLAVSFFRANVQWSA